MRQSSRCLYVAYFLRSAQLALALCVLLWSFGSAWANDIHWKTIGIDPATLKSEQIKVITEIYHKEFCYYGCADTIANCLKKHPDYKIVQRIAKLVVRLAKQDMPAKAIAEELRLRGRSAHPFRTHKIDVSGLVARGDTKAPVTMVIFADFQCPFCRIMKPWLAKLTTEMKGMFKIYFMQFPLRGHREAVIASSVNVAAQKQNKFWEMHDCLYELPRDKLQLPNLLKCASKIGLNIKQLEKDMNTSQTLKRVSDERLLGLRLGVRGTPTLFINGKLYYGEKSESELRDRIEEEYDLIKGLK
jgi:predicted DsbA family dithiol-disulfide isomerase